ncbi:FadR/GntR family transcriptional regulator [Paracoccus methylarcula]|nr:FCD domain-containing protein [Paracoccus methylarcula]
MNRTEAASQAIKELVERSGWGVGDRLPAETDLARQLGFGRSTIREVLRQWESLGIVTRRKSAGTRIVSEISTRTLHIPLSLQVEAGSILRMLEVRRPLELEALRLCCARASDDSLRRIRARGAELISVYEASEDWRPADHRFHREIHLGSGNDLFPQMIEQIQYFYTGPADAPLGAVLGRSTIPRHADLTEAVVARDADRAIKVMSDILTDVETEARELVEGRDDE